MASASFCVSVPRAQSEFSDGDLRMLKRIREREDPSPNAEKKRHRTENWLWLLSMVLLTVAVLLVYRFFLANPAFPVVLIVYMVIFTLFVLAYVIYNRGFSRRNLTLEMLPSEWSEEEKEEFIENGRERMRKSKWMLLPIVSFGFTFAFDMIELFVVPYLRAMFS